MTSSILISIICPDRVGLLADLTGRLFDLGANLGDVTFAVLGEGAEFTGVCSFFNGIELTSLEEELRAVEGLQDAEMTLSRFTLSPVHAPSGRITHRLVISGGDRPGLTARLCELFVQFKVNIVRLNAEHVPDGADGQYVIRIAASIPTQSVQSCLAAVANTAGELGLNFESGAAAQDQLSGPTPQGKS
ncbi:glycine cleavage system protein R [Varunaivibrio sulfuroxidans]|nr:ACT domain-containing protein [Varunaivibrio sulfuroxidans]WES31252.1 ACT domain-containing protein [Varunaivibrio sulfuroxidans]